VDADDFVTLNSSGGSSVRTNHVEVQMGGFVRTWVPVQETFSFKGVDFLKTGSGNDRITFEPGAQTIDSLDTGDGEDLVNVTNYSDLTERVALGSGNDALILGSFGRDEVYVAGGSGADTVDLSAVTSGLSVTVGGPDYVKIDKIGDVPGDFRFYDFEVLILSQGDDVIQSNSSIIVDGHTGYDYLTLAATTKTIGTLAVPSFNIASIDIVTYSAAGEATASQSYFNTSTNKTVTTKSSSFKNIEELRTGVGDDRVTGSEGTDVVLLGAGNDTAFGRGGDDRLVGGAGNDTREQIPSSISMR
jgi:Ca2+-binding RTX toxin-like protein